MRIAIIGAGPAAVGLIDTLARSGADGAVPDVVVFDPSPHPWRGRPYAPDLDSVLVNVPPAIMSVRHGDREHYSSWLGERGAAYFDPLLGAPLVPRALYGEYLEETAGKAMAAGNVRLVPSRVVAVTRDLRIRTEDGREHEADRLVLCVGSGTPADLYGLDGTPGYVTDPYPLARTLADVRPEASVAIIGSRLTAVDVAVSLAARGHDGPISLVSRGGMLPHVWQRPDDYRPEHLTVQAVEALGADVTLASLHDLLRAELDGLGEDIAALEADLRAAATEAPAVRLRRQIETVGTRSQARRLVQDACHGVMATAWPLLSEADRATLRRHGRLAVSLASPMVPVNAVRMLALYDSGQLDSLADVRAVRAVPSADGGFVIETGGGTRHADVVVNAVNPPPGSVPRAAAELVGTLLGQGLAARHPDGGILPSDPRVHVVGDLRGGRPFLTGGIPDVIGAAARAAQALTRA
ncbi:FAD/NAD(P)-binding protein [Spirillospora sp. NPDC052269]